MPPYLQSAVTRSLCLSLKVFLWLKVPWLIPTCDMKHFYAWHDSFVCATSLIPVCGMRHFHLWHDPFPYGMTHFYARYDWVLCVIVLFLRGHEYIPYVTWPIHTCDMMQSYVSYHSSLWVSWLTSMYVVKMRHVTHRNESWHYQPIYVYLYIWCGYD